MSMYVQHAQWTALNAPQLHNALIVRVHLFFMEGNANKHAQLTLIKKENNALIVLHRA